MHTPCANCRISAPAMLGPWSPSGCTECGTCCPAQTLTCTVCGFVCAALTHHGGPAHAANDRIAPLVPV